MDIIILYWHGRNYIEANETNASYRNLTIISSRSFWWPPRGDYMFLLHFTKSLVTAMTSKEPI